MTATCTKRLAYRGQYRPRGTRRWLTHSERSSSGAMWDELLVADRTIPRGSDLRVLTIRYVDVLPGADLFTFGHVHERTAGEG